MNNTLETLAGLNDDELRAVGARVNELLKAHDDERKAKALADARAVEAKAKAEARAFARLGGPEPQGHYRKAAAPLRQGTRLSCRSSLPASVE